MCADQLAQVWAGSLEATTWRFLVDVQGRGGDLNVQRAGPAVIPKYPFVVHVEHRPIGPERRQENHNYETLAGATAYAAMALKKPTVRTVRISVILEEHNNK